MSGPFDNGANFVRVALQVNPHAYLVKNNREAGGLDENSYNEALLSACIDRDVSIIAVTDHFSIAESMSLIEAAEKRGIVAFPGFEAAMSDGVHFLCIFERGTSVKEMERCIGSCGVEKAEDEARIADIDSRELLQKAERWNAVVVAAHATESKGLLGHLTGETRERLWKDDRLTAIALATPRQEISDSHADILAGSSPEYRRTYPLAVIYASDVSSPADIRKPQAWTWLKMSEPSLDGLRHAFLDPISRVRLPEEPEPDAYPHMLGVQWVGGFLDGQRIDLNPAMNVLVGPRGAGKSTVLESIRFALGLEPLGSDASSAHEGFVEKVLGSGTEVSLLLRDPTQEKTWIVQRAVGGRTRVSHEDGNEVDLSPADMLGKVEFFGQHEVAELARLPEERSHLLERFIPRTTKPRRTRPQVAELLESNREAIVSVLNQLLVLDRQLEKLPGITHRLEAYEKAGVQDRLALEAKYQEEAPLFDEIEDLLDLREDEIDRLEAFDVDFLGDDDIDGFPSAKEIRRLRVALNNLSETWDRTGEDLTLRIEAVRRELGEVRAERDKRQRAEESEYLRRLRDLKAKNIDGQEYLDLERQKAELDAASRKRTKSQQALEKLKHDREGLLKEWEQLQRREYQALNAAAKMVTDRLLPALRVVCTYQGDRRLLVAWVRDATTGQLNNVVDAIVRSESLDPIELASACRLGVESVTQILGVAGRQVDKLVAIDEEMLLEMEELWLPPTTSIELRVGEKPNGEPIWRGLENLSTGEKATSILLLLLLSSERSAPLVVDQPEDDLDNSFIVDDIVPRLRTEKRRRQFILSTHNPNIPVLGDAEQVIRLTPEGEAVTGGRGTINEGHTGSLDRATVRAVVEALEGGKAAFERRRRRYGY